MKPVQQNLANCWVHAFIILISLLGDYTIIGIGKSAVCGSGTHMEELRLCYSSSKTVWRHNSGDLSIFFEGLQSALLKVY